MNHSDQCAEATMPLPARQAAWAAADVAASWASGLKARGKIIHSNMRPQAAARDRGPSRMACTSALFLRACDASTG